MGQRDARVSHPVSGSDARLRAFAALPTWLLYRGFRRWLPPQHPWKRPISFDDWVRHATDECLEIGLCFGFSFVLCSAA